MTIRAGIVGAPVVDISSQAGTRGPFRSTSRHLALGRLQAHTTTKSFTGTHRTKNEEAMKWGAAEQQANRFDVCSREHTSRVGGGRCIPLRSSLSSFPMQCGTSISAHGATQVRPDATPSLFNECSRSLQTFTMFEVTPPHPSPPPPRLAAPSQPHPSLSHVVP